MQLARKSLFVAVTQSSGRQGHWNRSSRSGDHRVKVCAERFMYYI